MIHTIRRAVMVAGLFAVTLNIASAQTLEQELRTVPVANLARAARDAGDAARGAVVFHQPQMACSRCHVIGKDGRSAAEALGPDLTKWDERPTDQHIVEALLEPSKSIRKGYEPVSVVLSDGTSLTGLLVEDGPSGLKLRDPSTGRIIEVAKENVEARTDGKTSVMPAGQVNQLTSRQQFLDLLHYLLEIRDGGIDRARELQPPPSMFALKLPEYEEHVDHAGLIADLDREAYQRGEAIYNRLCINCHGDHNGPGSLPTALRFAEGKFKNGNDPYSMYQTLTRGFGFMVPQTWMVPQQKYDVIHYIREAYLKQHNETQLASITPDYLGRLPKGDTRGPEPTILEPWVNMDYGPSLINTYEIGSDGSNFAQKGIAVRLDAGPGGVSRGSAWMIFDHDTLRMAAAWTADPDRPRERFIDWNGIHFNGRHQVHPRIVGNVACENPTGPGWAEPGTGSLVDDARVLGRDDRRYGPLPRDWAQYRGLYAHGERTIIEYTVGATHVLEMPGMILPTEDAPLLFTRTLNTGPRDRDATLVVATAADEEAVLSVDGMQAKLAPPNGMPGQRSTVAFDGSTYLEAGSGDDFDMTASDFTIRARIRTKGGGTIFAKTKPAGDWAPDGKTFFVRGGRLCYDIGWVGVVQSKRPVNDGEWHDVALTWSRETASAKLYVDGRLEGEKVLRPKGEPDDHVVRIGYTSPNFPSPTWFQGELERIRFDQREVPVGELLEQDVDGDCVADWRPGEVNDAGRVANLTGADHHAVVQSGANPAASAGVVHAGLSADVPGVSWSNDGGRLLLTFAAGTDPIHVTLWFTSAAAGAELSAPYFEDPQPDLEQLINGGPSRWPQALTTRPVLGSDEGPFAVDVLTPPEDNPWLAQTRLTGLDFFDDGDHMAVCAWDGDVWLVSGLSQLAPDVESPALTWRRIATGLFQPLGIKVIEGEIFVTCRDQIVVLHDSNGDGETDYYRCFNNDHQVTEHFHEFAMGLQRDDAGNLYYAKSARHALPAIVPHHGTLLRVSPDGERTDILAVGFRAANGVCLNPDGTFVVTDQEGHWNPKNRINWVTEGGFYGNMFGYHDVTDSSDEAMQPPLCWITNEFDRSPAELLWVDSPSWGRLNGSLLNLSYGYGKVYVVPFEEVNGLKQGGMCEFPIPQFPTGVMRGRFHRDDGHLYLCGMFAWAGNQQYPGGLYRLRATGQPAHLPIGLRTAPGRIMITLTDPVDAAAVEASAFDVKVWSLKRTANYGSKHYDEHPLSVNNATLSADEQTITLEIPDLAPTWSMEIRCRLRSREGQSLERVIHNTIHAIGEAE